MDHFPCVKQPEGTSFGGWTHIMIKSIQLPLAMEVPLNPTGAGGISAAQQLQAFDESLDGSSTPGGLWWLWVWEMIWVYIYG